MFTITGVPKNRRNFVVTCTYNDGIVSCTDKITFQRLRDDARIWEGRVIGFPMGPQSQNSHLKNPYGAAWLMAQLFKPKTIQVFGDMEWPEIPQDTVI